MLDITKIHHIHLTKEQQKFAEDLIDLYFDSTTIFIDNKEDFFYFVRAIADKDEEFIRHDDEVLLYYPEEEDE